MQKWLALGAVSGEDSHLKIVVTVVVVYDLIPTWIPCWDLVRFVYSNIGYNRCKLFYYVQIVVI